MTLSPRLFVDTSLDAGSRCDLSPEQAHYLDHVMRRRVGDPIRVFNGIHGEWLARIDAIGRGKATIRVKSYLRPQTDEAGPWLLFAPLKRDATDLVVQKATELGATAIMPVLTERTNVVRVNESRLAAIAIEAAEQSERLTVPAMHAPRKLATLLDDFPNDRRLLVAVERLDAPHLRGTMGAVALLIGPEGGFSPPELDVFERCPVVTRVSLGPRILRAETACLAGLALLQAPGCG